MCTSIGPYFYTIINDYNRMTPNSNVINVTINETIPDDPIIYVTVVKFSPEIIALLAVLGFINIFLPIIALHNDRRDYNSLKNDIYDVNDEFLKKIALKK